MNDLRETAWDWVSCDQKATMCSSEAKVIRYIEKLAKDYPNEVKIDYLPEDNHGYILCHLPKSWMRLPKPPAKRQLTEEQKVAASERMKKARENL